MQGVGDPSAEVDRALRDVDAQPPGREQVAAAEHTLALADEIGNQVQQIQARINLVAVYENAQPGEQELPHLSWLLNHLGDEDSAITERQRFEVLWECRYALARTRRSAKIPLKIIHRVYADIEQRYRAEGVSPNMYAKHRTLLARDVESDEVAQRWFQAWVGSPRDRLSDCAVCDLAEQARTIALDGDHAGALAHAEVVLQGRKRCGEEPHRLYGAAADWAMRVGDVDAAERFHRLGWPLVAGRARFTAAAADHVIYLARAGRVGAAVRLALDVAAQIDEGLDDRDRMHAASIVARVLRTGRAHNLLPRRLGGVPIAEVIADLDATARDLSSRFDQRNGTDRVSAAVAAASRLHPYPVAASSAAQHLDVLERGLLGAPAAPPAEDLERRPQTILDFADALFFASDALDASRVSALTDAWLEDRSRLLPARDQTEQRAVAYLDRRGLAGQAARRSQALSEELLVSGYEAALMSRHDPSTRRARIELLHRAALAGDETAWTHALREVDQLEAAGELEEAAGGLMALSRHPDPDTGVAIASRAAELFGQAGKPHWQATALQSAGYSAAHCDPHLAAGLLDQAFDLAAAADRPQLAVAICATQAKTAWLRGDLSQARQLYAEAIAGADLYGAADPFSLRAEYAEALISDQQWDEVAEMGQAMAAEAARRGDPEAAALAQRYLGLAAHEAGRAAEAAESLDAAHRALIGRTDSLSGPSGWALGSSWLALDRPDLAAPALAASATGFASRGAHTQAATAHEAAGQAALAAQQPMEAAGYFAAAARTRRQLGLREEMLADLSRLAAALAEGGRVDEALATLAAAMSEARALSASADMSIAEEEQVLGRLELRGAEILARADRVEAALTMWDVAHQRLAAHGAAQDHADVERVRALVAG